MVPDDPLTKKPYPGVADLLPGGPSLLRNTWDHNVDQIEQKIQIVGVGSPKKPIITAMTMPFSVVRDRVADLKRLASMAKTSTSTPMRELQGTFCAAREELNRKKLPQSSLKS